MVIKDGKHRLVGFVDLGEIHDDMQILSGKNARHNMLVKILRAMTKDIVP